ncbi:MAG: hypothetical protein HUU35_07825, partial [Armatimonadetes bacterium]|nr:hypothetical protein [Armatimonadota bacterium]
MADGVGAVEARAALVLRHRRQLLREFVRRTGSWSEAEELVGELTLRALEELPLEPAAGAAWLARESEALVRRRRYLRSRAAA